MIIVYVDYMFGVDIFLLLIILYYMVFIKYFKMYDYIKLDKFLLDVYNLYEWKNEGDVLI